MCLDSSVAIVNNINDKRAIIKILSIRYSIENVQRWHIPVVATKIIINK